MIFFLVIFIIVCSTSSIMKRTFRKYSKVPSRRGITAQQVARMILDKNGLYQVQVEEVAGNLTDNYNPKTNVVSLSSGVMHSTSIAAIGVAAHECGHAVQHAEGYVPIRIRSALVPATNIGSHLWYIVFLVGIFGYRAAPESNFGYTFMVIGILLFSLIFLFHFVTLPVELNASKRAMETLDRCYILEGEELTGARKVLTAAAMTYVAALVTSLMQLLRLLSVARGGRKQ